MGVLLLLMLVIVVVVVTITMTTGVITTAITVFHEKEVVYVCVYVVREYADVIL